MGLYSQLVFPWLCELALNRPLVAAQRRQLLAHAHGDVLEIGFGTGLNLPHYPPTIRKITTVDPSVGMQRLARKRIEATGIRVEQRMLGGESLPLEDASLDCVVSTFTLCSIGKVAQALNEIYRVLRPGGVFLILEHGLSRDKNVQKWQHRLNWLEMRMADGCHLDRNIRELVAAQPFASLELEEFYLEQTPKILGYMYRGSATK